MNRLQKRNLQNNILIEFQKWSDEDVFRLPELNIKFGDHYFNAAERVLEEFESGNILDFESAQEYINKANDAYQTNFETVWGRESIKGSIPLDQRDEIEKNLLAPHLSGVSVVAFIDKIKQLGTNYLSVDKDIHITSPTRNLFLHVLHARTIIEYLDSSNEPDSRRGLRIPQKLRDIGKDISSIFLPQGALTMQHTDEASYQLFDSFSQSQGKT